MQVLKLGGSVLTRKGGYMELDRRNINSLAKMLGRVWKSGIRDMILIHGAGSFGHPLVLKYGIREGVRADAQKVSMALTHSACSHLSIALADALVKNGIPAITIPPIAIGRLERGRICRLDRKTVEELLFSGFLPVLHGDMMLDSKLGGSVCSGDQLVSYFGRDAECIILGTDVDGIIAGGKVVPRITKQNITEVLSHVKGAETADVTGGMRGKLEELLRTGKPAYIVNARYPERIEKLLRGKKALCTIVE